MKQLYTISLFIFFIAIWHSKEINTNQLVIKNQNLIKPFQLQKAIIFNKDFQTVKELIVSGVDINNLDDIHDIPINLAIAQFLYTYNKSNDDAERAFSIFRYLIEQKADLNKLGHYHNSPIHAVVCTPNTIPSILLIKVLIKEGANLNLKNEDRKTPLDIARYNAISIFEKPEVRKKYYKICTILEDAGAKSSIQLTPMPTDEIMEQQYAKAKNEDDL